MELSSSDDDEEEEEEGVRTITMTSYIFFKPKCTVFSGATLRGPEMHGTLSMHMDRPG